MTKRIGLLNGENLVQDYDVFQFKNTNLSVGISDAPSLEVTENTVPDGNVKIAAGICCIEVTRTTDSKTFKVFGESNGDEIVPVTGTPGNIGAVIAVVDRTAVDNGTTNPPDGTAVFNLVFVEGLSGSPLLDAEIDSQTSNAYWWIRLANVDQQLVVNNAQITDQRVLCSISELENVTANNMNTDVIDEKTGGAGVTIDNILLKDNFIDQQELGAQPPNPGSGRWRNYFKSDGPYYVDDAGVETKYSVGGAVTTKKAEAASIAGEIFENTDEGDRKSWNDDGLIRHSVLEDMLTCRTGTGSTGNLNVAVGTGAFNQSGNIDISVAPFDGSGIYELQLHGINTTWVSENPGSSIWSTPFYLNVTVHFDGTANETVGTAVLRSNVLSTVVVNSPYLDTSTNNGPAITLVAGLPNMIAFSSSASQILTNVTLTLSPPVFNGTDLRFAWTFSGNAGGLADANGNVSIGIKLRKLSGDT